LDLGRLVDRSAGRRDMKQYAVAGHTGHHRRRSTATLVNTDYLVDSSACGGFQTHARHCIGWKRGRKRISGIAVVDFA
jgi:hypothetical protein